MGLSGEWIMRLSGVGQELGGPCSRFPANGRAQHCGIGQGGAGLVSRMDSWPTPLSKTQPLGVLEAGNDQWMRGQGRKGLTALNSELKVLGMTGCSA